jgi:hypothetical protein
MNKVLISTRFVRVEINTNLNIKETIYPRRPFIYLFIFFLSVEESQNFEAPVVEVLDALIELAYTSKLNLTGGNMDTIGQLLRIASKYDITSLKKVAVKKAQAKGTIYELSYLNQFIQGFK